MMEVCEGQVQFARKSVRGNGGQKAPLPSFGGSRGPEIVQVRADAYCPGGAGASVCVAGPLLFLLAGEGWWCGFGVVEEEGYGCWLVVAAEGMETRERAAHTLELRRG